MLKRLTLMALCVASVVGAAHAKDWSIPLAGNAYKTAPQPGNQGFRRGGGGLTWSDPESVYSIFFHCDRPARLELGIAASSVEDLSELVFRVLDQEFEVPLAGDRTSIGALETTGPGYIRIDVQGRNRKGDTYGSLDTLSVRSETEGLTLDYVRNNQGNMFYWGRRGPSAHLRYRVPDGKTIQYAYNEITVPEGEDPIGSYFMANGFSQGYFGIQVNSPTERRVLFSVWSPYKTDNPREIPEDQRIETLGQGPEVTIGQFGNEGSGGQSYLRYPWEAGRTYRFLTEVRPDGAGKSIYTCWFGDKAKNEWRLIASFRRSPSSVLNVKRSPLPSTMLWAFAKICRALPK